MRAFKSLLIASCVLLSIQSSAVFQEYKSGISFSFGGYHDITGVTLAPDYQHANLGSYSTGGTLTLDYAQLWTFKNGGGNSCGGTLYYRVYRTCDAPGAFSPLALTFLCENPNPCQDTGNPGDQMWQGNSGANILSGLTLPGVYVIQLYIEYTGNDAGGGCATTKFINNGGNDYRAYFQLNINDSFTDNQFTSNPTWSGDAANIQVVNNSTCSGLIGTEQTRTLTMKLNAASGPDSQYLSTPISTWDTQQDWYFWIGRDAAQAATVANQILVWLYANEANLESATVDGYRISYGDDTGGDNIILQSVTNGTATNILTTSNSVPNGALDYGIAFYITRSQLNLWTIRTSYLPQTGLENQASPTPLSCPETIANVVQGTVTNADYTPSGTGYVGPIFIHSAGAGPRTSPEFDNLRVVARPPDTQVEIAGLTSGTANEDVANTGNLLIEVQLTNPSATLATTVDLVLTSGAAARAGRGPAINTNYAGPYTTITLTWAAGVSGIQNVYIDPSDNALCDDIAALVFTLQNPTGGNNAFVDTPISYTATIVDDNTGYETLINENFESGSIPVAWVTTGTAWAANSTAPINGTFSARHSTQASAGTSSIAYPLDDVSLPGINTSWRFHIKYQNDPSANNNFQVFLSANEATLYSATVDGYALVVDQTSLPSAGTNDYIRLYRVTNGAYAATPIINSTTDWLTNVAGGTKVALEVTLNDSGTWEVKVDIDGDFDALVSLGTGVDVGGGGLTYPLMQHFGVRFRYTAGLSAFIRFDDVTVSQKGCKETWYTQASGNVTGAIWGAAPVSAPQTVIGGRYKRFVIQGSATGDNVPDNVTANTDWLVNDINVDAGGTFTGGSVTTRVFGLWINDGTFSQATSTIHFKGQAAQSILGSATTTFNNVIIDNDGFNVTAFVPTNVQGVVFPNEGTLQTGGLITLLSSITGSASISTIRPGAAVSGNVTLQRYTPSIPWIYGNWVNLGCPIQGQTIADWNDDIITTGFIGSDYPAPYPFNNIRSYTESTAGAMSLGYVNATNVTDPLSSSNGYFVWLQGPAQNIDNTGAIQTGTFDQALSYTVTGGGILNDGWNLMTNPYPSEVDWNLVSSTFSVSNPRVHYVFDHTTNSYKLWNATSNTGTGSRYIPHSQSFLVKVNTVAQNLHYEETYKTNTGAAFERSYEETNQFVALKLERNGMSDECLLMFNDASSNGYEAYDAYDLESPNAESVEFSLMSADNVNLAQDCRPLTEDLSIPVYLDLPEAGTYTFSVEQVQNLPLGSCLMVEDLLTGNTIALHVGEQMSISTDAAYQGNRLVIHASAPVAVFSTNATCFGAPNGSIDVTAPAGNWTITLANAEGDMEYLANGSATFDHLPAGIYTIGVGNGNECASGTHTIVISEPAPISTNLLDVIPSSCNVVNDGLFEFSVDNTPWFSYQVTNSKNQMVASANVMDGSTAIVELLPAGIYTVQVDATCGSSNFTVNLQDPNATQLALTNAPEIAELINGVVQATFAASANSGDIHWTCSNGQTGVGNTFDVNATEEGVYLVTATATAGECSDHVSTQLIVKTAAVETPITTPIQMLQLTESLQLTFGSSLSEMAVSIELFDAAGRIAFSKSKNVQSGQQVIVPTTQLADGLYTIRVSAEGQVLFSKKLVK